MADHLVAGQVPPFVIDLLEMIDVEHQERQGPLVARGARELGDENFLDLAPVVNAGHRVAPALFGDYNNDQRVNAADYVVWRKLLGSAVTLPNENPTVTPNQVTPEDYTVWRNNFGAGSGGSSASLAAAVPEPQTACLLGYAVASVVLYIGRRY